MQLKAIEDKKLNSFLEIKGLALEISSDSEVPRVIGGSAQLTYDWGSRIDTGNFGDLVKEAAPRPTPHPQQPQQPVTGEFTNWAEELDEAALLYLAAMDRKRQEDDQYQDRYEKKLWEIQEAIANRLRENKRACLSFKLDDSKYGKNMSGLQWKKDGQPKIAISILGNTGTSTLVSLMFLSRQQE